MGPQVLFDHSCPFSYLTDIWMLTKLFYFFLKKEIGKILLTGWSKKYDND